VGAAGWKARWLVVLELVSCYGDERRRRKKLLTTTRSCDIILLLCCRCSDAKNEATAR